MGASWGCQPNIEGRGVFGDGIETQHVVSVRLRVFEAGAFRKEEVDGAAFISRLVAPAVIPTGINADLNQRRHQANNVDLLPLPDTIEKDIGVFALAVAIQAPASQGDVAAILRRNRLDLAAQVDGLLLRPHHHPTPARAPDAVGVAATVASGARLPAD
jgi:hypothetical protein